MSAENIKCCPECGSEYYAYIATCADCDVPLILPEEAEKEQMKERSKKPHRAVTSHDEWVAVREDAIEGIRELSDFLSGEGIFCKVMLAPGCSTGKCGCRYLLLTAREDAPVAHNCIEEFYARKHPEIKTSQEWESEGRCPACGYCVGHGTKECPDCGLRLMTEG